MTSGGRKLNYPELLALLVERFPSLDPEKVKHLDRWTVNHVYLRPRDKQGQLILKDQGPPPPADFRELFFAHYRAVAALEDWQLDKLFREHEDKQRGRRKQ